ncbi:MULTISPECIES: polyphosphate kinase 2 family protein [Bacillus cereus group]|uniref:polyphosphate kinase 2 family protein n=1 Tax=Bacillus cereus group TaxID=86661 RepID=UPI0022E4ABBE|nr:MULTISPECIES: UDP-galactose-lipid carrier transferase [unclassified Bacillus cereus group]MDA2663073.1 UDP-galactose-lipid carrier transferase [Bacillus cereus group sp. Bc032]MDA2673794.1 UDP-galactose-lipid carrier transferase [Bacillus cereus group sp. Bc031]MDA2679266.1 UDP-galactose-lipid carrier transferase [Bacillus cereus group sp. Bc029]MDA2684732.1 UDP-galactose-lipid carrier transferase [Bacillus cereus group sp. Bc030]MDA2740207.1 UDP-galactose-lipid carrier transferase [Bacillu
MEHGYLAKVNVTKRIESKSKYNKKLEKYQRRLLALQQIVKEEKIAVMLVMEGWDAAGKGGAIKRVTEHLDPRGFQVNPIGAPAPHEKRYHYLQRFWRKLPQYGQITIFDRSWYGRVLVERVEGFATKEEWTRAYDEINDFEKLLTDDHYIIGKFFYHISKDEQLKRFKDRENNPLKRWKITDEDWRNREKWDEYVEAMEDMFEKTNKSNAKWQIIASNDKLYARLKTLKVIISLIEDYFVEHGIELPSYYYEMKEGKTEDFETNQDVVVK